MGLKGYVLLPGFDHVIAVCRDDQPGFWLERYRKPSGFVRDQTLREHLGPITHVSGRVFIGTDSGHQWLMETFLPDHQGLLDDQTQEWLSDLEADIERAMQSLRDVIT
jgi:hypothetical protein